jgi:hypothetical protein
MKQSDYMAPIVRAFGILLPALIIALACVPSLQAGANDEIIRVVSSTPDQVSGGDARIEIRTLGNAFNANTATITVEVNGVDQSDKFQPIDAYTMSGVVDGLELGPNTISYSEARSMGKGRPPKEVRSDSIEVINHPLAGPIFSGEHQKAFVCTVQDHGLGQPVPDADTGWPVRDESGAIIGRSLGCQVEPLVVYKYRTTGGGWADFAPGDEPSDLATTTTLDGKKVPYIVRWERGSINRFIYSIAMLDSDPAEDSAPRGDDWNGRLLYYFQGGVAIGHTQGSPSTSRMLYHDALKLGYGVIYSTGTKTGTHYDLELGGETALMTKERFIEQYGVPFYTVSVGGSGGGIQQYIYGQNYGTRVIDAAIAQYSYPDMVTQAIHIGDCELLEFYMDAVNPAGWSTWSNRTWLIGLNAEDSIPNDYTGGAPGTDECVQSWRGLSPLVLNHNYGYEQGIETITPITDVLSIQWTHWEDAVNIYGRGANGFGRSAWDNVGVQYGLKSMVEGHIAPEEFLTINAFIGGWVDQPDMMQETCPFYPFPGCFIGTDVPDQWDPWSVRNMVLSDGTAPAPRTEGSIEAMNAAYEKGHVFVGNIDIPVIDWRHYLEHELDMHNSHQSFAVRQRMRNFDGDDSNQVIWFTDARGADSRFDQTPEALAVMDEWMKNIRQHPNRSVAKNKPAMAVDRCFDSYGNEIASGDDVWNGILDDRPDGACTQVFELYSTSRIIAGGPIEGGVFKCALQSVDAALAKGVYGAWQPSPAQYAMLQAIFPQGVCDYSQPDVGRP